jgi:hypothetical protein
MGLSVTEGNTIIFDSFTPEEEVRRRNINNNNISKLNNMQKRFQTGFCVGIQASSVTAVLCASTVSHYRVVDKGTGKDIKPSDKRPDYMKTYNEEQQAKRQRIKAPLESRNVGVPNIPTRCAVPVAPLAIQATGGIVPASVQANVPNGILTAFAPIGAHPVPTHFNRPHTTISNAFTLPRQCLQTNDLSHLRHITQSIPLPDIFIPPSQAPTDIMTFTSVSPPLSPRDISEDSDTATPFPFKHADHPMDQPPIFGDLPPQPGTSEDIRAVVFMGDVMNFPPEITDDIRNGASILQDLSKSATKKQNHPAKG